MGTTQDRVARHWRHHWGDRHHALISPTHSGNVVVYADVLDYSPASSDHAITLGRSLSEHLAISTMSVIGNFGDAAILVTTAGQETVFYDCTMNLTADTLEPAVTSQYAALLARMPGVVGDPKILQALIHAHSRRIAFGINRIDGNFVAFALGVSTLSVGYHELRAMTDEHARLSMLDLKSYLHV